MTTTQFSEHDLDEVRHAFDDVMAPPPPVDVRAYLLDPPPLPEELARRERMRLLVRRGSIAGTALLAVILLAPWPDRSDPEARAPSGTAAAPAAAPDPRASTLPERVDMPPLRARPRSARARPRVAERREDPAPAALVARPRPGAPPAPGPAPGRAPAPVAAPAPAPAPTSAPAPAVASPGPGVLVPVA